MTKADLIDAIAKRHGLPRPNAEEFLNGILDDVIGALKSGDKVNISGFGTFSVSDRKGRTAGILKPGKLSKSLLLARLNSKLGRP